MESHGLEAWGAERCWSTGKLCDGRLPSPERGRGRLAKAWAEAMGDGIVGGERRQGAGRTSSRVPPMAHGCAAARTVQ